MSDVFQLRMMGRWGNQLFQYSFARAYAEKHGLELQTQPWVGDHIFELTPNPIRDPFPEAQQRNENTIVDGDKNISYCSYSQNQKCLIYTRSDVLRWFKFRPEIEERLKKFWHPHCAPGVLAHRRVGDYVGYGYPVVSKDSYRRQAALIGQSDKLQWITEEEPYVCADIPAEYAFIVDFWRLMHAPILLRGNSCFSWWAGTLGNGVVYSPRIDGLEGGKEHDVEFELGNHCRFANLPFVTDLHLAP